MGAVAEAAAEMASEAEPSGAVVMAAAARRAVPMQSVPRPSVDSVVKAEQLAQAQEVTSCMQLPAVVAARGCMRDSFQRIVSCRRHPMQALQQLLAAAFYHRPSTQSCSKWTVYLEA